MTAYFTYASSLQAGDLAPGRHRQSRAPAWRLIAARSMKLGYKATLAKIDFTAALFRIERPFANIDTATNAFEISGDQINKGLELSAVGEDRGRI